MPMSYSGKHPKPKLTQKKSYSSGGGGKTHYSYSHYGAIPPHGNYMTKGNGVF